MSSLGTHFLLFGFDMSWLKLFGLSSEKGVNSKRKELLPLRINSLLLEQTPFGTYCGKTKRAITKVIAVGRHGKMSKFFEDFFFFFFFFSTFC